MFAADLVAAELAGSEVASMQVPGIEGCCEWGVDKAMLVVARCRTGRSGVADWSRANRTDSTCVNMVNRGERRDEKFVE